MKIFLRSLILFFMMSSIFQPAIAAEKKTIAAAPFIVHSKEDISSLVVSMEKNLMSALASAGFEVIEPARVVGEIDRSRLFDAKYMRDAAGKLGADCIVWGSITKIGQRLSLDVWLLEVAGTKGPMPLYAETTGAEQLDKALHKIVGNIQFAVLKKERIGEVFFSGNRRIESEAIRTHIKSKPGDIFNKDRLSEDMRSIFAMGYFTEINIDVKDSPEGKIVTFMVTEKPVIKDIKVEGNIGVETEKVKEVISVRTNSILKLKDIQESEEKIRSLYREKGYYGTLLDHKLSDLPNNEAILTFSIKEGEKVHIKEIRFVGNKVFGSKQLKDMLETTERGFLSWLTSSGILNRDVLERDLSKITSFYYNNGYIEAKIGEPEIEHKEKFIFITIPIEEGSQFTVGSVDIEGKLIKPKEELLSILKIRQEKTYSRDVLRKDILVLTDVYADAGYAYAEVAPEIAKDDMGKKVNITFFIQPGGKVHFDRIEISGNTKTRDKVIRRELRIAEGDQFNAEGLRKSNQRLQRLGFFEDVNIAPVKGTDETKMDLNVEIKEKPTGAFSIGGGYSSVEHFIGMAEISQRNLFGRGQELSLRAQTSSRSTRYNLSFTEPYFLDTKLATGVDLFNWETEYDDYTKKSTGGGLRLGYPLTDNLRVFGGYRFEDATMSDVSSTASWVIVESMDIHVTSSLNAAIERDTRNSYVDPTAGSINSFSIEYAGGFLGGDSAYTKYTAKSGWYYPLFWDTVGHINGAIGYVKENPDGKLPVYEKFYLGGLNSVRGFKFGDISPIDPATGERIGGEKMLLFNVEYIFPLIKKAGLKGVVFFDAGNAFREEDSYNLTDLRTSVGFGFRWFSPIGPLRLEWGYNIDPEPGEKSSSWDFTIGGAF
ncbi:MAG: outer membrane protein assembly factor BamA [Thermodesulfobacteriota bacterium]|nr:outer membrane protein assembly factor BamA [Thermodesulfobacteriota bacterium]